MEKVPRRITLHAHTRRENNSPLARVPTTVVISVTPLFNNDHHHHHYSSSTPTPHVNVIRVDRLNYLSQRPPPRHHPFMRSALFLGVPFCSFLFYFVSLELYDVPFRSRFRPHVSSCAVRRRYKY